jgi:hypothetical protein
MTADEARKIAEIANVWDSDSFVCVGLVRRLVAAFPEHPWVPLIVDQQPEWLRPQVRERLEQALVDSPEP